MLSLLNTYRKISSVELKNLFARCWGVLRTLCNIFMGLFTTVNNDFYQKTVMAFSLLLFSQKPLCEMFGKILNKAAALV